ncbi:MAG: molybdate ABC transporter substrate-binding protein [Alphaproteobacteria bacterium]|nr:molybdate ABC transporter substrate-binding protein [Alphaproteobacteria bacterium]
MPPKSSVRRRLLAGALALFAGAAPAVAAATFGAPGARAEAPLTVFAAASLTDALTDAAAAYRARGGEPVRLVFESSSTLARQIEQGAPAHLFLSANPAWMDYAAARGLIEAASRRDLLANALVLIAPADAAAAPAPEAVLSADAALATLLPQGARLAMGDPDHVPAGIYARQALQSLGQWEALAPRIARAANVRTALALTARREAPLGIVYATDALADPRVAVVARFPADSHAPIRYPAAITRYGLESAQHGAARAFLDFLSGADAGAVFARHGFQAAAASPPS